MAEAQSKRWMADNLTKLRTLRDEVRLDMHLASMEAKTRWKEMEPMLHDLEKLGDDVTDVSKKAVEDMLERLRSFRDSIRRHTPGKA